MAIRELLLRKEQGARRQTYIDHLKSRATIIIDEQVLASLTAADEGKRLSPALDLPSQGELRARAEATDAARAAPAPEGAVESNPKLRLAPGATRHGLIHKFGKGNELRITPESSRAERAKVEEVQERMRKSKAEAKEEQR